MSVLALVVATVAILPVRDQHVRHGSSRKIAQDAFPVPTDERLIPLENQAPDDGQSPGFALLKSALVFLIHSKAILIPALLGLLVVGLYAIIDEYDAAVAAQYMPSIMFIALWGTGRFILEGIGAELHPSSTAKSSAAVTRFPASLSEAFWPPLHYLFSHICEAQSQLFSTRSTSWPWHPCK